MKIKEKMRNVFKVLILLFCFLLTPVKAENTKPVSNATAQTTVVATTPTTASSDKAGATVTASKDTKKDDAKKDNAKKEKEEKPISPNAPYIFLAQMLLLLVIIYFGIKHGGVSLGLMGGLGVAILVFVFGSIPGKPPVDVMLIILAVVTTSSTLEASGALGLIVKFTEKILRKNPNQIVFLAPMSTFFLTMLVGTGHALYPLLPVIYDVAYKQKIRPERPMAIASVASQMGITASPIAAATAAMIGIATKADVGISLIEIMRVTIPACFLGMMLAALWSLKRGKELSEDPEYLAKMQDPKMREYIEGDLANDPADRVFGKDAKTALVLFFLGILAIIIIAIFPKQILPLDDEGKPVAMTVVLQFVMLAVGAIIIFCTSIKAKEVSDSKVFNAGMVAVIMIFGIAWMSETVISNNESYLLSLIKETVNERPWTFAIAMFLVSMFLKSQAAVITVMMPIGFALGLPKEVLIGCIPAGYAYFFFCFYPSDLAAINFDRTGTTHVGKYILNHSFMIPGLIGTISATAIAYFLSTVVFA